MSELKAGVDERISNVWDREPEWRKAAWISATALAIKIVVSNAAERAASSDSSAPTTDERRRLAHDLLRATDRMQHVCGMATGLLYTCVIPQQNTIEAQQWAARQMVNFRRVELRIDELVYDMVTQHGPPSATAAAKLVKLLATAAWADPRMSRHGYHLMDCVAGSPLANLPGGSNGDLPTESEIDAMPARLDSARGGVVQFNPTHPFGQPASEQ